MSERENAEAWRELAIETIRNLSALIETAEALLKRAQKQLDDLDAERNN